MSLRPPGSTEKVNWDLDITKVMDGTERYPVIGDLVSQELADQVSSSFYSALLYGSCLEKNSIAKLLIEPLHTEMFLGEIRVWAGDMQSAFGYDFNPPIEFHAFLMTEQRDIIDFALPGTMLRGMSMRDRQGPYLYGRDPIILAGKCPNWIKYKPIQHVALSYFDSGEQLSGAESYTAAQKRITNALSGIRGKS